jgi:hypothetical protein
MPFLDTSNTTIYYDIFEPNFTTSPLSYQGYTLLLIHGFGGTPESDFGVQLPEDWQSYMENPTGDHYRVCMSRGRKN